MNNSKLIGYSLLLIMFAQCKTQQFKQGLTRDGKCFAKCLILVEVMAESEVYMVYTGNESEENVEVDYKEIITQPASTRWVKKKADKNCLSADPNDCLVWCLVNEEEKVRRVKILVDTTQSNNYVKETIVKSTNPSPNDKRYFEWKEVLCQQDITKSIISQIQTTLRNNQSYYGEINGDFDEITQKSLTSFQKDNGLPIGQLDFETLDVLGIAVEY